MAQRIIIKNGCAAGFADELRLPLIDAEKQRVSVIVPRNLVLRVLFVVLRALVSDESRIAEWTRHWDCDWDVVIDGEHHGPFADRQEAVRFEKDLIQASGKIEAYLGTTSDKELEA